MTVTASMQHIGHPRSPVDHAHTQAHATSPSFPSGIDHHHPQQHLSHNSVAPEDNKRHHHTTKPSVNPPKLYYNQRPNVTFFPTFSIHKKQSVITADESVVSVKIPVALLNGSGNKTASATTTTSKSNRDDNVDQSSSEYAVFPSVGYTATPQDVGNRG